MQLNFYYLLIVSHSLLCQYKSNIYLLSHFTLYFLYSSCKQEQQFILSQYHLFNTVQYTTLYCLLPSYLILVYHSQSTHSLYIMYSYHIVSDYRLLYQYTILHAIVYSWYIIYISQVHSQRSKYIIFAQANTSSTDHVLRRTSIFSCPG